MSISLAKRYNLNKSTDCCGSSEKLQTKSVKNSVEKEEYKITDTVSFSVDGMTCMSCVNRIETALVKLTGVSHVFVDFASRSVTIHFDSDVVGPEGLNSAIERVGYTVTERKADVGFNMNKLHDRFHSQNVKPYSILIGIAAALSVVGFYLGLLTLTSDWTNAKIQFEEYRWWIIALSLGLGTQASLFSFMRKKLLARNIRSAKSSLATSGGMSTASMAACCAHYLVPLMPALGLPFLSAAVAGIASYQTEIFILGVLSNLFGLGVMLRLMHKNGFLKVKTLRVK